MSLSEYELLAENDKKLYLESTLPIKRQEALQRRMRFVQQMTEMRRRKVFTRITLEIDIMQFQLLLRIFIEYL